MASRNEIVSDSWHLEGDLSLNLTSKFLTDFEFKEWSQANLW
jgi:hypothetical protein